MMEWIKQKHHSVLFKSLEQHYLRGKMFPRCPNCNQPFDFQDISGWVNAEHFKKRGERMNFKPIPNWLEKNLTCARCGERRSVKYEMNGKTYCNGCVLLESLIPDESTDGR